MRVAAALALCVLALASCSSNAKNANLAKGAPEKADGIKQHRRQRRARARDPMVLARTGKFGGRAVKRALAVSHAFGSSSESTLCGVAEWAAGTYSVDLVAMDSQAAYEGSDLVVNNVLITGKVDNAPFSWRVKKSARIAANGVITLAEDQQVLLETPIRTVAMDLKAQSKVLPTAESQTSGDALYTVDGESMAGNAASAYSNALHGVCFDEGQRVLDAELLKFSALKYFFAKHQFSAQGLAAIGRDNYVMMLDTPYTGAITDNKLEHNSLITIKAGAEQDKENALSEIVVSASQMPCEVYLQGDILFSSEFALDDGSEGAMDEAYTILANDSLEYRLVSGHVLVDVSANGTIHCYGEDAFTLNKYYRGEDLKLFSFKTKELAMLFSFEQRIDSGSASAPHGLEVSVDGQGFMLAKDDAVSLHGTFFVKTPTNVATVRPLKSAEENAQSATYNSDGTFDLGSVAIAHSANAAFMHNGGQVSINARARAYMKSTYVMDEFLFNLNAGATLNLTGPGLTGYMAMLPAGTLDPSTFCYYMTAGESLSIMNIATGATTGRLQLTVDTTLCPTGILSNSQTSEAIGYVTIFGTIKLGGIPPQNIPPNCMDMVTGMMILVQRGDYAHALQTCRDHGMEPLDVTGRNIAAASALLEACGGLVVSSYVGSFDGLNNNSCLALYTGSTSGIGTVATAPCNLHKPVMCIETP